MNRCLLCSLLGAVLWSGAAAGVRAEEGEVAADEIGAAAGLGHDPREEDRDEHPRPPRRPPGAETPLGRTVQLVFSMQPAGEFEDLTVTTATQGYRIAVGFHNEAKMEEFRLAVEGTVRNLAVDSFLVGFAAEIGFEGQAQAGEMQAQGSVQLRLGQQRSLVRVGEKTLLVRLAPAED